MICNNVASKDNSWHRDFLLVLFVAVFLRVFYAIDFFHSPIYPNLPYTDGYYYSLWANDIASGELIKSTAFMKWPLYAYFLSLFDYFFSDPFAIVYFLQFAGGVLHCFLIYFIAFKIFNRPIALLAALLSACYGPFIFYEGLSTYTSFSILSYSMFFVVVFTAQKNLSSKIFFRIGLLLGLCVLLQGNIFIFGVASFVWLLTRSRSLSSKALSFSLSFFLGLGLILGSTALMNYIAEKDIVPVTGNLGFNFYSGNNLNAVGTTTYDDDITFNQEAMLRDAKIVAEGALGKRLKTSETSQFWFRKAVVFIQQHPWQYLCLLYKKVLLIFAPYDVNPELEYSYALQNIRVLNFLILDLSVILPLALLGAWVSLKKFREAMLLYLFVFSFSLSMVIFFVIAKLRILIVPPLLIFAAFGIYTTVEVIRNKQYVKALRYLLILTVLFVFINHSALFHQQNGGARLSADELYEYCMNQSANFESNKDFNKAIQTLKIASAVKPNNRRAPFRLAFIYYSLGDLAAAEENFKRAIDLSPTSVDAYYNLGLLYNQQQRFAEAKRLLMKAEDLNPDASYIHFELGLSYKGILDTKNARKEFELALNKIARWRTSERALIANELDHLK